MTVRYLNEAQGMKVGDVVHLKSSSPAMTIEKMYADNTGNVNVLCQWFNGSKLEHGTFNLATLEKPKAS